MAAMVDYQNTFFLCVSVPCEYIEREWNWSPNGEFSATIINIGISDSPLGNKSDCIIHTVNLDDG